MLEHDAVDRDAQPFRAVALRRADMRRTPADRRAPGDPRGALFRVAGPDGRRLWTGVAEVFLHEARLTAAQAAKVHQSPSPAPGKAPFSVKLIVSASLSANSTGDSSGSGSPFRHSGSLGTGWPSAARTRALRRCALGPGAALGGVGERRLAARIAGDDGAGLGPRRGHRGMGGDPHRADIGAVRVERLALEGAPAMGARGQHPCDERELRLRQAQPGAQLTGRDLRRDDMPRISFAMLILAFRPWRQRSATPIGCTYIYTIYVRLSSPGAAARARRCVDWQRCRFSRGRGA